MGARCLCMCVDANIGFLSFFWLRSRQQLSEWLAARGHLSNPICAAFPKLFLLFGSRVIYVEGRDSMRFKKCTQRGKRKL